MGRPCQALCMAPAKPARKLQTFRSQTGGPAQGSRLVARCEKTRGHKIVANPVVAHRPFYEPLLKKEKEREREREKKKEKEKSGITQPGLILTSKPPAPMGTKRIVGTLFPVNVNGARPSKIPTGLNNWVPHMPAMQVIVTRTDYSLNLLVLSKTGKKRMTPPPFSLSNSWCPFFSGIFLNDPPPPF